MGIDTVASPAAFGERERTPWHVAGMPVLALDLVMMLGSAFLSVAAFAMMEANGPTPPSIAAASVGMAWLCVVGPVLFAGFKVLKPNEAFVFTLFGKYHGCLREAGFYFVNPFVAAVPPHPTDNLSSAASADSGAAGSGLPGKPGAKSPARAISLKASMVSNLLVVLCSNKDAQPVVNSGSIY